MTATATDPCTAFAGDQIIARGALTDVALKVKAHLDADPAAAVLVFRDLTGAPVDLDLRGSRDEIAARLAPAADPSGPGSAARPRGRGRPKLGVVSREVTLLPRHWDWLAGQRGGASATLRRLVDEARRRDGDATAIRAAREAAYRFMSAMAGNRPGFEEAARALFAGDAGRLAEQVAAWPADIREYALALARSDKPAETNSGEDRR